MRKRAWDATGGPISADGSEDNLIAPEGLGSWPGPHPPGFSVPVEWNPPQPQVAKEGEAEAEEEDSDTDEETSAEEDSDEGSDA